MSAAISIGYENNPALTSASCSDLSLKEWANVKRWYGKKQFKYGFGGCSACALKSKFGKKIKATHSKAIKPRITLSDLQGIARANNISLTECKELGKAKLEARLKKMGLLNKRNIKKEYHEEAEISDYIPFFTFFGKKPVSGICKQCS